MIRLLIGGSPCTHWSIAQTKNRETEPKGLGWELFKTYLIALEKFKPDFFLYENNKSVSPAIRAQITKEFGVEPILINSALVSAQNRQRLYWTNIPGVEQPEDRRILLRNILESATRKLLSECEKDNMNVKPVRVGTMPNADGKVSNGQGHRIYSIDGKAPSICSSQSGGNCDTSSPATRLYAVPLELDCAAPVTLNKDEQMTVEIRGRRYIIYEVKDGQITIKGKNPIKLPDGFYIIRKLTVTECKRLQTVPEEYIFPVSDTQAYKMLGNGWTVDVIAHILHYVPGITEEPLEVLSMYDGMSCGRLALNKLGSNVVRYYATEIDKYAMQTTQHNFPDTIQLGDAFQVRDDEWSL